MMKMQIQVSEESIAGASKCCKEKSCLSQTADSLCNVVFCVNGRILGVLGHDDGFCSFKHTLEDRTCCSCPVRIELYAKYNI
jgi:hypothetical protein